MTFDPSQHVGHQVDMTETTAVSWFYNTDLKDKTIRLYDYSTGDGEGDYTFYCQDCQVTGTMPDDWDMDWI